MSNNKISQIQIAQNANIRNFFDMSKFDPNTAFKTPKPLRSSPRNHFSKFVSSPMLRLFSQVIPICFRYASDMNPIYTSEVYRNYIGFISEAQGSIC